jgi:hypothetical protein
MEVRMQDNGAGVFRPTVAPLAVVIVHALKVPPDSYAAKPLQHCAQEVRMAATDSPIECTALTRLAIGDFLDALASDAILPGAGAAGGIALALAAACAGKAVAITRRHDGHLRLIGLQSDLRQLSGRALTLGQQDALQFKQQIKSDDPNAAQALLRTDHTLLDACRSLERLLDDNRDLIADNMAGDWKAARALLHACRVIHSENVRELKGQG